MNKIRVRHHLLHRSSSQENKRMSLNNLRCWNIMLHELSQGMPRVFLVHFTMTICFWYRTLLLEHPVIELSFMLRSMSLSLKSPSLFDFTSVSCIFCLTLYSFFFYTILFLWDNNMNTGCKGLIFSSAHSIFV